MTQFGGWCLFWALCANLAGAAEVRRARFEELLQQGRQAEKAKDYSRAVEVYREMVLLQPNNPVAQQNLGIAFYLQSKYTEAVGPLEKALAFEPNLWGA